MLTDDDLTRQLRTAFREGSDDLTYSGRVPQVRRAPAWASPGWVALPAAAAVATAMVLTGPAGAPLSAAPEPPVSAPGGSGSPEAPRTAAGEPSAVPTKDTVTEEIELAGLTLRYERARTQGPRTLHLGPVDTVPSWAASVPVPDGIAARAWIGTDPDTDRATLYLESPVRDGAVGERTWGLHFPGVGEDGLRAMLATAED